MTYQQPIFVHTIDGMYIRPLIEDLSCNHVNIQLQETGSLHVISYPTGARICINDVLQLCTTTEPEGATINNIPSSPTGISHKYKLTYPGYVNIEGNIKIYTGQTAELIVVMQPSPCPTNNLLLYISFAIGVILLSSRKKDDIKNKIQT